MMDSKLIRRRDVCKLAVGTLATTAAPARLLAGAAAFRFRWVVASCLYGKTKLAEILPEVRKAGAEHIDIWPARQGNQREQIEAMGHDRFAAMLKQHNVKLGIITRYDLGPFGLQAEMQVAKKLGATVLITGSGAPVTLTGAEIKSAVKQFVAKMKPHLQAAERLGITIAIENHGHAVICTPDSLRWLADLVGTQPLGISLAPYHLPQNPGVIAKLIEELGPRLVHLYAWQHGHGCSEKLSKAEKVLQLPGQGPMDFTPIARALQRIHYRGWTEIFMHPAPVGIPIRSTPAKVTAAINDARSYLEACLRKA